MTAKAYSYGNEIIFIDDEWRYPDNLEIINNNPRSCPKCSKLPTPKGHDACLGELPGIREACCGHGIKYSYIVFDNKKEFCKKCYNDNYDIIIENGKYKIINGLSCVYYHPDIGCVIGDYIFK